MNHQEIQILVSSSMDGEINESEKMLVDRHLRECVVCRQFLETMKKLRDEIQNEQLIDVSSVFSTRIVHAVEKNEKLTNEWLGIESFARNTFISIVAVVLLLFFLTNFKHYQTPGITEVLINTSENDSIATQVLLQSGDLSKNDLLYAVMMK